LESLLVGILGLVFLLILLLLGVQIGISLATVGFVGSSLLYLIKTGSFSKSLTLGVSIVNGVFFTTASNYVWIVLPLFILMGLLAAEGGLSYAAYSSLSKWVGRLPGGLGLATIGGQTGFGTCTGSSLVTALVFAKVSFPEMVRYGYEKRFSYGLISAGGTIGMLIPPSVTLIVYGLLSNESVGKLLIGGIGPGLTLAAIFSVGIMIMVRLNPRLAPKVEQRFTLKQKIISLKDLWVILVVAVAVIGGIMWGLFTATEAGATGSLVVFLIGLITRKLKIRALPRILEETAKSTAMVFLVFIGATIFSKFLTASGVAKAMMTEIGNLEVSPIYIIVGFMLLFMFLGMFLDNVALLATTVPVIHPIAVNLGIDPIWFALLTIMAVECGLITPPVGLNVYAVKSVAGSDINLEDLFKACLPFFLMMVGNLILLMLIPGVATWLPSLVRT
jgi:tripartite ATP-independent transporter DctM subunit